MVRRRAADAGVPFAWVTGDEVYGGNPELRQRLEERQLRYVMAVARSETVAVPAGSFRADDLAALVPAGAWQRLSCADGSKGPRLYDWALIETADAGHWLLARRSQRPGEKGQYRHVTLSMLAHAFLAVTAHATRPKSPQPTASGNDNGEPGKSLWTDLRPTENI